MNKPVDTKWRRFQKIRIDKKHLSRRFKKAETATVRHAHKFILRRWSNVREVRRVITLWVMAMGILIAATGLQLLWNQREYQTTAGALGGTYAEATIGPVDTLNPLFAVSNAEDALGTLLFSRLLDYDKAGALNYDLAKKLTTSEDGKVYTVVLRDGVKWHDGEDVTADDIIFTAGLLKNPSVRSEIRGWSDVTTTKVDDKTVVFTLPSTYASFQHALTFPILPSHILSSVDPTKIRENDFGRSPVGSGPFKLAYVQDVDAATDRKIVHLEPVTNHYAGSPKLARFQLHVYPNRDAIVRALTLREVNAATGLSRADADMIEKDHYLVSSQSVHNGVYAFLNTESTLLKDTAVRKALQHATNTKALRDKIGTDVPELSLPFIQNQVSGEMPKPLAYDVDQAKKTLDDAGWKLDGEVRKKGDVELRLRMVTTKDSEYERALETLIGQWRAIGVAVDEQIVDSADPTQNFAQTVLQPRNYDVLLYQIVIGSDPDVYAYWHSSQATARGLNLSNYSDGVSDDALSSARTRLEPSLRAAKYVTFANQWVDDVPAIALYQSTVQYVHTDNVKGLDTEQTLIGSKDRYKNARYWTVGERTVYKTP